MPMLIARNKVTYECIFFFFLEAGHVGVDLYHYDITMGTARWDIHLLQGTPKLFIRVEHEQS